MGVGTAFHYLGSTLLFVAVLLTIVVDVSAPVVEQINFLKADQGDRTVRFGALGYCQSGSQGCSKARIGYNPGDVLESYTTADFSNIRSDSTAALTRVFILQYVGTGVTFIAFLLSLPAGSTVLGILATLACFISFIINVVAAAVEWVVFSLIRNRANDYSNISAKYGPALYLSVVAAALCLIATILMFVTCCAGRRKRKATHQSRKSMNGY